MLRALARPAASATRARLVRGIASETSLGANEFVKTREAVKAHAKETTDLWRKISFYVCIPGIIVGCAWTWKLEAEHHEHLEHIKHEHDGELPERPAYDYLNIRNKPFPWGMQTLFFNPEVNVPAGDAE
ncbi:Cytochrome c oxidase subunit 6A [Cryptotrichosporon argae]